VLSSWMSHCVAVYIGTYVLVEHALSIFRVEKVVCSRRTRVLRRSGGGIPLGLYDMWQMCVSKFQRKVLTLSLW
jgi:hypothetical protein